MPQPVFLPPSSHSTPHKDTPPTKTRLSRTLSDTPSSESEPSDPGSSQCPQKVSFSPHLSDGSCSPVSAQSTAGPLNPPPQSLEPPLSNGKHSHEAEEEALEESFYHSFLSNGGAGSQIHDEGDTSVLEEDSSLTGDAGGGGGDGGAACGTVFGFGAAESGDEESHEDKVLGEPSRGGCGGAQGHKAKMRDAPPSSGALADPEESPLIPMTLYLHRVKGLVLALLVEPHFLSDTASMEEVVRNNPADSCDFISLICHVVILKVCECKTAPKLF